MSHTNGIEFKKEIPQQTTINQEMSCLRRVFSEVAVTHGFISKDTVPDIPSIRLPKDQKHRRDDLTAKEWEELERVARLYWIKGTTRILDKKGFEEILDKRREIKPAVEGLRWI